MSSARAAIVAAIIVEDGHVLMVRRRVTEGGLSWQFPAGEMEPDETPYDTARRETLEEVGLAVEPVGTIGERDHPATGRRMIYVSCAVYGDSDTAALLDTEELDLLEWCTWSEVMTHVPVGLYKPLGEHLQRTLAP